MYTLTTKASFDAAHFLAGYVGKCGNLHGHRWSIVLEIKAEELQTEGQERGMALDFGTVKKKLKAEADYFDHCLIAEENTLKEKTIEALKEEEFLVRFVPFRPTAENFAKYFFDKLSGRGLEVASVTVYETPDNCARYAENE